MIEMIDKLQLLKGKTKLKYRQNYSNVYSEMQWKRSNNNFQFEDRFARNKKGIMPNRRLFQTERFDVNYA